MTTTLLNIKTIAHC